MAELDREGSLQEDVLYEECPRCHGGGSVRIEEEDYICATCNSVGYIRHEHADES